MKLLIGTIAFTLISFGCFAQNVRADGASAGSPSIAAVNLHPSTTAPVVAPAPAPAASDILSESDLRSLLTSESLSENENDRLYVVRTNPLEFKKVCWLPYKRASYTINVPPGGRLLHLKTTRVSDVQGVTVKGLVNDSPAWMHVPILVSTTGVDILQNRTDPSLVTLYTIGDTRALLSTLR